MPIKSEGWSLGTLSLMGGFVSPEFQGDVCLYGVSYGDDRRPDGRMVRSSPIACIEDGMVRTESGSLYELGEVCPDYEKLYPNAKERVLGRTK